MFQELFDFDEKLHGVAAIDEAVIVGEGDIHHGAAADAFADAHGAALNGVHSQDGALGRVENRRGEERAEYASIGDGKRSTAQFF